MALAVGTRLGPYEIMAPIGTGGMGEVYRARDTNLDRDVAVKVLPSALAQDPERLARFEREAKVLAALNHPNIAQIYGVEQGALVMELVEGENLSGPVPLATALDYARQIADALEAAHEKGIVHRDLKPANIKVTPQGVVKVLDFGLAAVVQNSAPPEANATQSPTLTLAATQMGVLLGTAAYMSPEQARGKPVDKRADIWAFGAVLYEIVTGRQLFHGDDITATLAAVVLKEQDLEAVPPQIRRVLRRCLEKDPKKRLRDISGVELLLQETQEPPPLATGPWRTRFGIMAAAAALFAVALAVLSLLHFREVPQPLHTLRYTIAAPENNPIHSLAVSPDGRFVVMAMAGGGKRQLWLRPLDALQSQPMPTTDDARYPFWSPDSRYIAFFAQGQLRKIAVGGGPSQSLCDVGVGRGGSWNRDDVIVFSPSFNDNVIRRVPATGGAPTDVLKSSVSAMFPVFLPDGRHFLYVTAGATPEKNGIYLASLDGKQSHRILPDVTTAVFAPSGGASGWGHILFLRENNLMAQPFDAGKEQAAGDVFPVAEGVSVAQNNYAPITVSENGVLLYWSGGAGGAASSQILWYDRAGKILALVGASGAVRIPSLSPDEKMMAFTRFTTSVEDIWVRDLVRGTDRRFTSDPSQNVSPIWSPTGDRLVFRSSRGGHVGDLYQKAANGSGQDEVLLSTPNGKLVTQWSRDGKFIVYEDLDPKTGFDIWVLPMSGASASGAASRKPIPFLRTEFNEFEGQISPDGRWMAYTSEESGQREVYVRPFPASDGIVRISTAGGEQPRWRGDGMELFYVAADGKMTVVAVKATASPKPSFDAGAPMALFDSHLASFGPANYFNYDVTANGKRFLAATAASAASGNSVSPITVVVNWTAGLKK